MSGMIQDFLRRFQGVRDLYFRKVYVPHILLAQPPERISGAEQGAGELIPGGISLGGVTRMALQARPGTRIAYAARIQPHTLLRVYVGYAPAADLAEDALLSVTMAVRDGGKPVTSCRRTLRCRDAARGWSAMSLNLAPFAGRQVEILLAADGGESSRAGGQILWASPGLYVRNSYKQIWNLLRSQVGAHGLLPLLRKVACQSDASHDAAAEYAVWVEHNRLTAAGRESLGRELAAFSKRPLISILTPVYNVEPRWLERCVASVREQVYPDWELCLVDDGSVREETLQALRRLEGTDARIKIRFRGNNGGISAASNDCLALATGEFVGLLDDDDELAPDALFEVAKVLNEHPDTDYIYSDEDNLEPDGTRVQPLFKPDWSPEYFFSVMYTCHFSVYRRRLVEERGGFRLGYEGSQDYDLALRVVEGTGRIRHIPKVLYHWRKIPGSSAAEANAKPWALAASRKALEDHVRRTGEDAVVENGLSTGLYRLRRNIKDRPLVTIFIPAAGRSVETPRGSVDLLAEAVRSIAEKTDYQNFELLVVDDGYLGPEAEAVLRQVPHRRLSYRGEPPFNFSRKVNFSIPQARGRHLVIFNDDLLVLDAGWLRALLEHSQRPEVGGVGAKLYYPDLRLQHVGMALGLAGSVGHVYQGRPKDEPGHFHSANVPRDYSAVTGACFMTRREVFDELGGFDETFAVDFNDVDYCLRARAAGYRIVYTPYARLIHRASASFGPRAKNPAEVRLFTERWGKELSNDPFYNPNFSREHLDCRVRLDAR